MVTAPLDFERNVGCGGRKANFNYGHRSWFPDSDLPIRNIYKNYFKKKICSFGGVG